MSWEDLNVGWVYDGCSTMPQCANNDTNLLRTYSRYIAISGNSQTQNTNMKPKHDLRFRKNYFPFPSEWKRILNLYKLYCSFWIVGQYYLCPTFRIRHFYHLMFSKVFRMNWKVSNVLILLAVICHIKSNIILIFSCHVHIGSGC